MSKISLSGNPSGTGTFTIASPNSNTDRTLNLPDAAGTLALTSQIPAAPTIASTAEAEAGTNNTNFMTPLRTAEQRNATALGWGQTWQDVTGSRSSGVSYTNSTTRPISIALHSTSGGTGLLTVGGVVMNRASNNFWYTAIIPVGVAYNFNGGFTVWVELR